MRALILLVALVPACELYGPEDDPPFYPDAWGWPLPDAARAPDANVTGAPCDIAPSCTISQPGFVTVCGRLYDVETDDRIESAFPSYAACGAGGASDGACQLGVYFYDALDLASDPTTAPALVPQQFQLDDCGRFVARNVPRPTAGSLAIVADDAPFAADTHRRTAVSITVGSGEVVARQPVHALRTTTDDTWATQAGLGAMSFADRGAVLAVYLRQGGLPTSGVTITAGDTSAPDADAYFSDLDSSTRATVSTTRTTTGVNGSALLLGTTLQQISGTGGEAPGCAWSSHLASTPAGILWMVHVRDECKI